MSTNGVPRAQRPCSLKRNQCETGSTIGSTHNQHNMHTTINSISEDDPRNFFYKPLGNMPVNVPNYHSIKENENHRAKRY